MNDINPETSFLNTHYPSKKDWWLTIILLSVSIICLYMPINLYSEPINPFLKVVFIIFSLTMAALMPWILFSTHYVLTSKHLIISCLSLKYYLPLKEIYEVYPTHNPLSAPALSLDRLRIKFTSQKFGALISPRNKLAFMQDLLSRCPQLIQDKNRLILNTKTKSEISKEDKI